MLRYQCIMGFCDISVALVILLAFYWCFQMILKTILFFCTSELSQCFILSTFSISKHYNCVYTAERVIHTRLKQHMIECDRNKVETIHSTRTCDYKEICFLYRFNVFFLMLLKRIYSAFIMQHNDTCQFWFLEMHSLLINELPSFHFFRH